MRIATPDRPGIDEAARTLATAYDLTLSSGDHAGDRGRWQPVFGSRMWFRQSPDDKLAWVREQQAAGKRVLMVGDGLNDAGALAVADVGLAVADETACIVPACDGVIGGDRLTSLPAFLRYARAARHLVVACFIVSVFYNVIGLSMALAGALTPLATAILMPVSSLTIVGMSAGGMRLLARWMLPQ
jgi:Cu+-exporting ATPase